MFNEHHFLGYGGMVPNPAVLLAAAAARTSKIRLGPCIAILPLRHPLSIAEDYAMVDAISGGRLEFGIGSADTELAYRVFDVARDTHRERFEEAVVIISNTCSREGTGHRGALWEVRAIALYPRP